MPLSMTLVVWRNWGADLEAVHLQPPLVIDVHVLLLGSSKELLIVQQLDVSHRLFHLNNKAKSGCAVMVPN